MHFLKTVLPAEVVVKGAAQAAGATLRVRALLRMCLEQGGLLSLSEFLQKVAVKMPVGFLGFPEGVLYQQEAAGLGEFQSKFARIQKRVVQKFQVEKLVVHLWMLVWVLHN